MWVRAWAGPGRDMGERREGECGRVYGQREGSRKGGGDAKGGYIPRIVTAVQTWIETDKTPDPPPSQIEIRRQQPRESPARASLASLEAARVRPVYPRDASTGSAETAALVVVWARRRAWRKAQEKPEKIKKRAFR